MMRHGVIFLTILAACTTAVSAGTTEDGLLAQVLLDKPHATRADCLAVAAAFSGFTGDLTDIDAVLEHLDRRDIHHEPPSKTRAKSDEERLSEGPLAVPATRGFACLLFQRSLPRPTSLMSRLFPGSERYAYRYLQQRGAIPAGGASTRIPGDELVGLWRHCRDLGAALDPIE